MEKLEKLKGNPVYYQSDNGNVVVTYNMFGLGKRYTLYVYKNNWWNYCDSFETLQEAVNYSKKVYYSK